MANHIKLAAAAVSAFILAQLGQLCTVGGSNFTGNGDGLYHRHGLGRVLVEQCGNDEFEVNLIDHRIWRE